MTEQSAMVRLGVSRLLESERGILERARVGLIAHSASVDERGKPTLSLLVNAGIHVERIFSPEHGYNARAEAGERVSDSIDSDTGLPICSLYGEARQPSAEMLEGVDALVFDLQDVGVRCYTYIWTMALAMQAAALFGKLFVVLDRPNPLGGLNVQGPILEHEFASFLGIYPVPLRYGLTVGELALLLNESFGIGANLAVVRMKGWRRRLYFSDTGLQWIPPSPAIRSAECALTYAGTCLFEGTNLSEGRGTSAPFRLIGAPWLDVDVVKQIDGRWLAGFAVSPQKFTPVSSKHAGIECAGLFISVVDRQEADPIALSVALLSAIASRRSRELEWNETHFDAVAGTDALRREICAGKDPADILESWRESHRQFERIRARHLLYEG
ncbi:DUF1343 domain-containing protein [Candidatus Poribacteria bacterium]|nr:DUF1343 domain-containing protein [Candidatus Poribacteria bacterium]